MILMRWILILLAVMGITTSALALREHYRTDTSPCSINERWDCGIVNHSHARTQREMQIRRDGGRQAGVAVSQTWSCHYLLCDRH